jgi:hypothetical protein
MMHFYRFATGVITGAIAATLFKNKKAQDALRGAVASGANAIRKGSSQAKAHFAGAAAEAPEPEATEADAAPAAEESGPAAAAPRRRPARNSTKPQKSSGAEE